MEEILALGLDDYLYGDGVCVVEWAEKALAMLPQEHLLINLEHLSENERRVRFKPKGERHRGLISELEQRWN
jgi:tRNA threonylcarbamoyladenosine biosynthesis protein TsaE